jgi:hypothetical protein
MRVLLDENLDWRLERTIIGHDVESVRSRGWTGIKNGALLILANEAFDVFLTMDGNIQFQQGYTALRLSIVALRARSNRLADTAPLIPRLLAILPTLKPGTFTIIDS